MRFAICLAAILLLPCVVADMGVGVWMDSGGGDITVVANPNSGNGTTTYILDGKNFDEELDKIYNTDWPDSDWFWQIADVFIAMNGQTRENYVVDKQDLWKGQLRLRQVLDTYFVPRTEVNSLLAQQQQQIGQLILELRAMGKFFTKQSMCDAKILVMHDYNISSVDCGNTTYFNHNPTEVLAITVMDLGIEEETTHSEQPKPDMSGSDFSAESWERFMKEGRVRNQEKAKMFYRQQCALGKEWACKTLANWK